MIIDPSIVTDAFVMLLVGSDDLSVEEILRFLPVEPTSSGVKGTKRNPRSAPLPWNFVEYSTEKLIADRDLNLHIREIGRVLEASTLSEHLASGNIRMRCVIYWWTTETVNFQIDPASLTILASANVPVEFNFLVDVGSEPSKTGG
jgi:hypothetical protein